MREPYEVTLARCFLAGGDSPPIKPDTTHEIARALIEMYASMRLQEVSIQLAQKLFSYAVDTIHELQVELVDTQRERNRNRQYVGEAHELAREIVYVWLGGDQSSDKVERCFARLDKMAEEVGR